MGQRRAAGCLPARLRRRERTRRCGGTAGAHRAVRSVQTHHHSAPHPQWLPPRRGQGPRPAGTRRGAVHRLGRSGGPWPCPVHRRIRHQRRHDQRPTGNGTALRRDRQSAVEQRVDTGQRTARRRETRGVHRCGPALPDRLVGIGSGHRQGRTRLRDPVRERTTRVRRTDQPSAGGRLPGLRYRDRTRGNAADHASCCRSCGAGQAVRTGGRARPEAGCRTGHAYRQCRCPTARRTRLYQGTSRGAVVSRSPRDRRHGRHRTAVTAARTGQVLSPATRRTIMINLEPPKKAGALVNQAYQAATEVLRPISRKYDRAEHAYPSELDMFAALLDGLNSSGEGGAGAGGVRDEETAQEQGNRNGSNLNIVLGPIEMCYGDVGMLLSMPRHGRGNACSDSVATPEWPERFSGTWAAMAITEPGCGSDSAAITATAERDGDEYVLNGEKIFVTAGERADSVVVWATLDRNKGRAAMKSFVVEKGTPGFEVVRVENKLGIRASDTAVLRFDNCRVPKDNLLGSPEIDTQSGFAGV